jgi:hypothetical protein
MWLTPDTSVGDRYIYGYGGGGTAIFTILLSNFGGSVKFLVIAKDQAPTFVNFLYSTFAFTVGVTYFVTISSDGNRYNLTVNGANETLNLYNVGYPQGNDGKWLGSASPINPVSSIGSVQINSSFTQSFSGVIDEFGMWNRALTYEEINQLYNGGNGRQI